MGFERLIGATRNDHRVVGHPPVGFLVICFGRTEVLRRCVQISQGKIGLVIFRMSIHCALEIILRQLRIAVVAG